MGKRLDKISLSEFLFISGGDPAGIGPEVIRKSLFELAKYNQKFKILYFFNSSKKEKEKIILELENWDVFILKKWEELPIFLTLANENKNLLFLFELGNYNKKFPSIESAKLAFLALQTALEKILEHSCKGFVTAPLSKYWIQKIHRNFTGHTGYLSHFFRKNVVMILYSEYFSVLPITEHIPIKNVPKELLKKLKNPDFIEILREIHKKRIFKKKWAFLGLNPHCGDFGGIGKEEIEWITPFIKKLSKYKIKIEGPFSSDSFFTTKNLSQFDLILGCYHDQVLIPFKTIVQLEGINITFGLPFIRTSPDHGTAYDIAFKEKADHKSMLNAILFHYKKKWN